MCLIKETRVITKKQSKCYVASKAMSSTRNMHILVILRVKCVEIRNGKEAIMKGVGVGGGGGETHNVAGRGRGLNMTLSVVL